MEALSGVVRLEFSIDSLLTVLRPGPEDEHHENPSAPIILPKPALSLRGHTPSVP